MDTTVVFFFFPVEKKREVHLKRYGVSGTTKLRLMQGCAEDGELYIAYGICAEKQGILWSLIGDIRLS